MKKIFFAASLIIAATSITCVTSAKASTVTVLSSGDDGQHISASAVPAQVRASFHADFPGASNAQWEKEREHGQTAFQVDFLNNGKKWRAVFAPDGTLLSSGRK